MNCIYSKQDNENVSSWPSAYTIASNVAGDHPAFNVDYQTYFEPYAKWIWAPTEAVPPRSQAASSVTGLNCAFCRADRLAKRPDKANVRGKYSLHGVLLNKLPSFLIQRILWTFSYLFFIMLAACTIFALTLICDIDLDVPRTYICIRNEACRSRLSNV